MSARTAPLHATLEDRLDPAPRPQHPIVNGVHRATEASTIEHIEYLRARTARAEHQIAMGVVERARQTSRIEYARRSVIELAEAEGRALGQLFRLRELDHDDSEAAAYQRRSTALERALRASLRVAGATPDSWRNA